MFEFFIVFVFGLVFGSFANVCIYRMPRNMSIVKPNSHCTNCNTFIKWYDNIPILSYVLLKGKCRNCNSTISIKYPLVEFFCGVLFLSMYYLYGFTFMLIPFCIFVFSLLVTTVIDFEFKIIPDEISFMLMIVGVATSFLNLTLGETIWQRFLGSLLGFLAGGGSLFIIAYIGKLIFKQDAMGGGDIKIMAGIGAFIGWDKVLFAIFVASLFGSIVGIALIICKKIGRKQEIPFGPYLAISSYLTLFFSPQVIINYLFMLEEKFILKYLFVGLQNIG
jgi:leader peptidase (prepilin peptidase)/N-methyltransferase